MKSLVLLFFFSLQAFASMPSFHHGIVVLAGPHQESEVRVDEVLAYTFRIMRVTHPELTSVVLVKGSAELCKSSAAYTIPARSRHTISLCSAFYQDLDFISKSIRSRTYRTDGGPYFHVSEAEVLKRYAATVIIHEMLHLLGHQHGEEMYLAQERIFSAYGVQNFYQAPHPELSSWARFQLGQN